MIQAKVIADSKNIMGNRITTMIVTLPRFILAELNTHRMFSRNSASSRAIPFEKMVKSVEENPFIPIAWQKDHKGMQGVEYFSEVESKGLESSWLLARDKAVSVAKSLSYDNLTKQLCNRLLEPFMWHTVIITATDWENFFALRCPQYSLISEHTFRSKKDALRSGITGLDESIKNDLHYWLSKNKGQAEIHMMVVAEAMWDAYNESTPKQLKEGEWHIPFEDRMKDPLIWKLMREKYGEGLSQSDWSQKYWNMKAKISTAMNARISYTVVGEEGKPINYENDIKLHDKLVKSGHWSPLEHIAQAMGVENYEKYSISLGHHTSPGCLASTEYGWCGNFRGFIQYRKTFAGENKTVN